MGRPSKGRRIHVDCRILLSAAGLLSVCGFDGTAVLFLLIIRPSHSNIFRSPKYRCLGFNIYETIFCAIDAIEKL
jgi:hypothetical protein